jgi:hypothetical protein
MLREIYAAYRGTRLWARLERKYKLDQGIYVLLMPDNDPELNAAALGHIDDLVSDRRAQGVVLVGDFAAAELASSASRSPDSAADRSPHIVGTESWTSGQIDALLTLCELYGPSDRLLIVSLTRTFGNNLHRLLGRQGVTKEDLVCLGCLRLRGYGMVKS